jgi:hypothetical protein
MTRADQVLVAGLACLVAALGVGSGALHGLCLAATVVLMLWSVVLRRRAADRR